MESSSETHPISRAKMLEMWKATNNRGSNKGVEENRSNSSANQCHGSSASSSTSSSSMGSAVSSYYRNIFDGSGLVGKPSSGSAKSAATRPLVSPSTPNTSSSSYTTTTTTPSPRLNTSGGTPSSAKRIVPSEAALRGKDATLQSLAEQVSAVFPPESSGGAKKKPSFSTVTTPPPPQIHRSTSSEGKNNPVMKNIAETQFLNSNKNFGLSYHHHRQLSPEDTSSKDVQGVLLKRAISQLEDHLRVTQGILRDTQVEYDRLQATNQQNEARLAMAVEDHEALNFVIAVQNLKIRELEVSISNSRLQHNETLSEKHRKHKSELRRLNRERIEYEARAESMIAQMTEQMNALQTMAMARIEDLERELMEERQKSSPKWKQYYTSYKDNGGSGMDLETSSKCSDEDGDKKTSRRRNTLVKVVEVGADAASPASPLVSAGAYSEAKSSPEGGDEEDEGYLDEI